MVIAVRFSSLHRNDAYSGDDHAVGWGAPAKTRTSQAIDEIRPNTAEVESPYADRFPSVACTYFLISAGWE